MEDPMKLRSLPILASLAVLLALALAAAACGFSQAKCEQCGRMECGNLAFTIHLRGGKTVETCCPRCGLHAIESGNLDVQSMTARDFNSKAPLAAETAFYVDGSDVTPCATAELAKGAGGSEPPKDERGCCLTKQFDRCLPSLLAFGSKEAADAFSREHGGDVRSFDALKKAGTGKSAAS
jgi:hypothetical protein